MQKLQQDGELEPKKPRLSLNKETLRRLTPAELRLVAGGDDDVIGTTTSAKDEF